MIFVIIQTDHFYSMTSPCSDLLFGRVILSHELIVDGIVRTCFHAGAASYAFRVVRRFEDVNIHFACLRALHTSDTTIVLHLNAEEGYFIK